MSVLREQGCIPHNRSRRETHLVDSDTRDLDAKILFLYGRNIRLNMAVERMRLYHDVVVKPQSLEFWSGYVRDFSARSSHSILHNS